VTGDESVVEFQELVDFGGNASSNPVFQIPNSAGR
jgi:hypothetical protein